MRITGGIARGILLKSINHEALRPATDAIKEAVFSSLGDIVSGAKFLDLFAGVGSYGLESFSRGAESGLFIEQNRKISAKITENLQLIQKSMGKSVDATVKTVDVFRWFAFWEEEKPQFDLIFLDPPYALAREQGELLLRLVEPFLSEKNTSRIIYELPMDADIQLESLELVKRIAKTGKNSPAVNILRNKTTI